ncbi:cyclin-G1-like [Danio aesculapii]|uniref:cyclin-G1-like n=1 Tax=Danio aesculapii TaxID=1142201 RepID=UPI0024C0BDA9|nr:cyclin-G1-like [Danio aesculapii]
MIDQVTGMGVLPFAVQLKSLLDQTRYQPKHCGLCVIESAQDNGLRMTVKLRDYQVRELLSLTRFFGFCAETFSFVVNLLDRFLAVMKIQPRHLSCVGLCCFYITVKTSEEKNVPLASDLIRISQNRFTVHDMMRMEKIILEKLNWMVKAPAALHFLRFFHSHIQEKVDTESKRTLNIERFEAQLKVCHCSFTLTKLKPSLLALSLLALEIEDQHEYEPVPALKEALDCIQQSLNVKAGDLVCVRVLVAKCLVEYSSTKCQKPNGQRLRWMISGRTARQLKHSYYKTAHLPTIPEYAC